MKIVDGETSPIFPENCDIVNSWCYSYASPWCPPIITNTFTSFCEYDAEDWSITNVRIRNRKTKLVASRFLQETMKQLKTHNIFMCLMNAMKIQNEPKEMIAFAMEYFSKRYCKGNE